MAIWSLVLPLAPRRTVARAEVTLRGDTHTLHPGVSWHRDFRRTTAKEPLDLEIASMAARQS